MPTFIPHLLDEDISAHEKRRLGVKTLFTAGESLVHLFLVIIHRMLHRSLVAIDVAVWQSATGTSCIRPPHDPLITLHVTIPWNTVPAVYSNSVTSTLSYLDISSMIALPPVQTITHQLPIILPVSFPGDWSMVRHYHAHPTHDNTLRLAQWL